MVSKLDLTLEQIRAEREVSEKLSPPLDTAAIFAQAQRNAALVRSSTPRPLTPEAEATPAVIIGTQSVQPRTDLVRFLQPVTIKGH